MTNREVRAVTPREIQEFMALTRATDKKNPDKADVTALRVALEKNPNLWRLLGDLQKRATLVVIEKMGVPTSMTESLETGRLEMQKDLGYQDSSPLERLLIDHAILCWLRQQLTEYRYEVIMQSGVALAVADYNERRMNATQARFLRSLETLARVRRLLKPVVAQVNIAGQQVNVAQTGHN